MTPKFYVSTWDYDLHKFTPQKKCRTGPYSKWGLRRALRKLQELGYDTTRENGFSVFVENRAIGDASEQK